MLGRSLRSSLVSLATGLLGALAAHADDVLFESGLEYSNPDGQHLQLNLARPKEAPAALPAVVCIHGGGFRAGNRNRWDKFCEQLAQHGYAAATVSYRLAPKYPFPSALHDVKAAVRWLRANASRLGIDPARIGAMGDSAGATLAQCLGVTAGQREFEGDGGNAQMPSAVACVVSYYGASDFTRSYGKSVDAGEVLPLYLGGNLEQARHRHILASPLYWVTPQSAPMLLIHGTKDPYVALEQATWMRDRLVAADVEVELFELKDAGHGFKGEDAQRAERATIEFFDKHLKPRR